MTTSCPRGARSRQDGASATLHCLTGGAIGEVLGMVIGTALGFSQWDTVALAVGLACLFGYSLTSLPLLRAGYALSTVASIAFAVDTFSITTMEIVDNAVMLLIPGAIHEGVGGILFWGALSFAFVVAGIAAFPVNRWLLQRGKGHAVLHETGIHGGGAGGHLVALREGDLAYMHVHPTGTGRPAFEVEFADASRYRLFVQFKPDGRVHTAAFTHRGASLPAHAPEADRADPGSGGAGDGHGGGH